MFQTLWSSKCIIYKVCILSSKTHTYKDCTSSVRSCVNCNGPHCSMFSGCLARKKLISEKLNASSQPNFSLGSGAVKTS